MNLIAIFLTGLLTGGLTCLAVQGGLLTVTLAQNKGSNVVSILAFLATKLVSYTILGMILGQLGSIFQLSITTQIILQVAVVFFMVGSALNLLNVHPIFRYFAIQPPRFLTRLVRNQSKSENLFAPAILGAFTIFIPCGTTQAMMALAIASANPLTGSLIMFSFILGTSPVFFILGYLATKLGEALHQKFMRVAAATIILLAIFNLNSTLALATGFSIADITKNVYCTVTFCGNSLASNNLDPVSEATININSNNYSPNVISVKAGSQVTLKLVNINGYGCIQAFTIPKLNIRRIVPPATSDTITFTAPSSPGDLPFMCSMGMYRGVIKVV